MLDYRIKVAYLDYSYVFAGAERMLHNMIEHLDRNKYEPILIMPYPMGHHDRYDDLHCEKVYLAESKKWWMGSDVWKHPLRGTDFLKRIIFGFKIKKLIARRGIKILDVNIMQREVGMWVWASRKFTNVKLTGHYRSHSQNWVAPKYALRLFHVVACVSKFSQSCFIERGEYVRSEVVYDSVDVDLMKSDLTREEAKETLGYQKDDLLIVSVGQLSLHKGHDTAIKAFARIKDIYPSVKLLVAGGGEGLSYYRQLAKDSGVEDRVSIPGHQMSNIQTIYRAADLTLSLTKVGEGFGLVPYESALLGTPFIAPDFGAIKEFVTDGETGLLVDTNNIDAVVKKICFALDNPYPVADMISKLKVMIRESLHPRILSKRLDEFYSKMN